MAPPVRRAPARNAPPQSSGYRGEEGLRRMREEEQNAAARREAAQMNASMPFRFFCPVGETRELVIVDYDIREAFFRFEHNLKDKRSGKWNVFCACINENANCPVCSVAERPSYFAMYLTVIDLTPYENKDGIEVPWSKKLLVIKSAQQKKITRLAEREGTLRGMILRMTRDGEKDASIGNDIEFEGFMSEDDLLTYETVYEYEDSQGKKKEKEILGHEAFDYDELFPMPTEQQLRAIVGGAPGVGSREEARESIGRGARRPARGDDWPDEAPARRSAAPARRTREEVIDPEDNPEMGTEPVSARRAAPARREAPAPAAPARRAPVARRAAQEEEPPEEEVQDPPQRRAAPGRAAPAPARAPVGRNIRAARPDPEAEQDYVEEEAPRSASSLADRRRALRR